MFRRSGSKGDSSSTALVFSFRAIATVSARVIRTSGIVEALVCQRLWVSHLQSASRTHDRRPLDHHRTYNLRIELTTARV